MMPNSSRSSAKVTELAPLLLSAWVLGLLGGGHCLGMCGGLMGALTMAIPPEQRAQSACACCSLTTWGGWPAMPLPAF